MTAVDHRRCHRSPEADRRRSPEADRCHRRPSKANRSLPPPPAVRGRPTVAAASGHRPTVAVAAHRRSPPIAAGHCRHRTSPPVDRRPPTTAARPIDHCRPPADGPCGGDRRRSTMRSLRDVDAVNQTLVGHLCPLTPHSFLFRYTISLYVLRRLSRPFPACSLSATGTVQIFSC